MFFDHICLKSKITSSEKSMQGVDIANTVISVFGVVILLTYFTFQSRTNGGLKTLTNIYNRNILAFTSSIIISSSAFTVNYYAVDNEYPVLFGYMNVITFICLAIAVTSYSYSLYLRTKILPQSERQRVSVS